MWVCSALSFWMCISLPATICKYVITFVALVVTAVRAKRLMIQVDPAMPYGVSSTFHIFTPPKWGICEIVLSTGLVPDKFLKLLKEGGTKWSRVLLSEWFERFGTGMLVPLRCRCGVAARCCSKVLLCALEQESWCR